MPARKMRIEIFDNEGNKYSIAFEGQITREKALRLLDLVELLGGVNTSTSEADVSVKTASKFEKVLSIVQKNFPIAWFSSKDVQAVYEQEFKEPVSLSTIATYLGRMTKRGLLIKAGPSRNPKYRVSPSAAHILIKQQLP